MSADPQDEVARLLRAHGAVLVRGKKHKVYRFPDGRSFTHASTPSDTHAWANSLRSLRTVLGLNAEGRGAVGERRERVKKPGRIERSVITPAATKRPELRDKVWAAIGRKS